MSAERDLTVDRLLLPQHHDQVQLALRQLLQACRTDDSRMVRACFVALDAELARHLEAEETLLLPGYSSTAPKDAAALRADHTEIRRLLDEIGISVDVHQFHLKNAEALERCLREHAAREDRGLYPWAVEHLPRNFFDRLAARLTRVAAP